MVIFDPKEIPEGACIVSYQMKLVIVKAEGKIMIFELVECPST